MFCRVLFCLGLTSTLVCLRANGGHLCSYEEVLKVSESVGGAEVTFCLTGKVVQSSMSSFMLSNGNRLVGINGLNQQLPSAGDEIVVWGHTSTDYTRAKTLYADRHQVLSKGKLAPPVDVDLAISTCTERFYTRIRTTGTVLTAFRDEVDPRTVLMAVRAGSRTFNAAFPAETIDDAGLEKFLGAQVRLTGVYLPHLLGRRIVGGRLILMDDASQVEIMPGPAVDIYDVPRLKFVRHADPEAVSQQDRRKVSGVVRAVWRNGVFLVRTEDGQNVQVTLAPNRISPSCGENVEVSGFPETDLFHVNLVNADFRGGTFAAVANEEPVPVSADELLMDADGRDRFAIKHHGELIRVKGVLCNAQPGRGLVQLACGRYVLPLDISACPDASEFLTLGMTVEATGVCIMETDVWRPNLILPHVRGIVLVPRRKDDIRVVARPSWWTRDRILYVLAFVGLLLVVMTVWNRALNRLVVRRSRVLAREQIARSISELKVGERTRLAVELHDSLSQNLAGVAFQVATIRNALSSEDGLPTAVDRLDTAERMLKSCRTELRNCLFDLRSDTLDEPDFTDAIRRTLERVGARCKIAVRFSVRRSLLLDSMAHAVLSIIRELTSNAVVHGRAASVKIAGSVERGCLLFSVTDDGCGFDLQRRGNSSTGHYGLDGIADRVRRLNGDFKLESSASVGTRAVFSIPLGYPFSNSEQ